LRRGQRGSDVSATGGIEQAIETLFSNAPSQTFSTEELVTAVFPGVNRIEKKHRVAVLRAADKVAKRRDWAKWQCERWFQGGGRRRSSATNWGVAATSYLFVLIN
jgi:hypothetical protein